MKRLLVFGLLLVVAVASLVGGYYAGSNSRDEEVTSLSKQIEKWESRETQLKLREARAPQLPKGAFPDGFPKVVAKAKVPENLQDQVSGSEAVAVAPGVWADYPPGADIAEAATSTLFGYCSSIKSYERMYTPGNEHSNTCL